ncbi:DNA-binding GntR family transcriptional regulator [Palleronia aestuarii]|uniref:DNA-binding GntR family transcriptional regulator n=1 Tax=Palleronia aestuarii TaxID=568105 RepID=A0A2W7N3V9_9RHOB|nr:GntR family transcriptional regulator [Palleronia aestuarii]PZX14373.1 DNA-binding GntR family transcriptional regulator [Palleronia aestuarii]
MDKPDFEKLPSLPPEGSRGQAVFEALRAAIHAGHLRPGMTMREEQVAERFSLSRTPVREAFARLLGQSLLEHGGGRGLIVRSLGTTEVYELYAMREVLEGAAAGLAAHHAGPAEHAALQSLQERFSALSADDIEEAVHINRRFHDEIRQAARNRYLDGALDQMADGIALLGETTLSDPERHAKAVTEHQAILDAIKAGDATAAESAGRQHIHEAFLKRKTAFRS